VAYTAKAAREACNQISILIPIARDFRSVLRYHAD
jgi:hypothetical protein